MSEISYGEIGVQELVQPQTENQVHFPPRSPELAALQERAFARLEQQGIVSIIKDENGRIDHVVQNTFDIFKTGYRDSQNRDLPDLLRVHANDIFEDKDLGKFNSKKAVYFLYKGIPVVSKENPDAKPRNMFFVPRTAVEAVDPKYLQTHKDDHFLGLHEVGKNSNWNMNYPTEAEDFNSEVTMLDVAVPHMIYNRGNGKRDEAGTLWVDAKINSEDTKRRTISGKWFLDNFAIKGTGSVRLDTPREFVLEYGAKWAESNALTVSDFSEANWAKTDRVVTEAGYINLDNQRFYIGTDLSGSQVEQLAGQQYLVYQPGDDGSKKPDLVMNTHIKPEDRRELSAFFVVDRDKLRGGIVVPRRVIEVHTPDKLGSFVRYLGPQTKEKIDISAEFTALLSFRDSLPEQTKRNLSNLSLPEQISVMHSYQNIPLEKRNFLDRYGTFGMKIMSAAYMNGDFDARMLDYRGDIRLVEDVFSLSQHVHNLTDTLVGKLKNDSYASVFLSRVEQSFASRAQDLLIAAQSVDSETVSEQVQLLSQAITHAQNIMSGNQNYTLTEEKGLSDDKQRIVSLTGKYDFADGNQLSITVRPEEVVGSPDTAGHARVSFSYRSREGRRVNIRIDFDEYGVSLDIGKRGGALHQLFSSINKSHHTQDVFDSGFQSPQAFELLARKIPASLGWKKFSFPAR